MPSNLSADERAAVEKVERILDKLSRSAVSRLPGGDEVCTVNRESITLADLRTLLAVVARAGEPVAWAVARDSDGKVSFDCDGVTRMLRTEEGAQAEAEQYQAFYGSGHSPMPLYAHPADARDRGDASADTRRLDWMDSNSFTAYRSRDPETSELCDHAVVVAEDAPSRFGNIGTIRAAIDHAMHAAPAAPEDK